MVYSLSLTKATQWTLWVDSVDKTAISNLKQAQQDTWNHRVFRSFVSAEMSVCMKQ